MVYEMDFGKFECMGTFSTENYSKYQTNCIMMRFIGRILKSDRHYSSKWEIVVRTANKCDHFVCLFAIILDEFARDNWCS